MKKGFTLIELLVVIAIIGIIISVIVAAISNEDCKENPKQDKCRVVSDEEYCKQKARYLSVEELPALCLQFYAKWQ